MSEVEHSLLVSFPDDSQSFVNGFEAGMIWAAIYGDGIEPSWSGTVHAENAEVISRMAEAAGAVANFWKTDYAEWLQCKIERKPQPARKLSVVKGGIVA